MTHQEKILHRNYSDQEMAEMLMQYQAGRFAEKNKKLKPMLLNSRASIIRYLQRMKVFNKILWGNDLDNSIFLQEWIDEETKAGIEEAMCGLNGERIPTFGPLEFMTIDNYQPIKSYMDKANRPPSEPFNVGKRREQDAEAEKERIEKEDREREDDDESEEDPEPVEEDPPKLSIDKISVGERNGKGK